MKTFPTDNRLWKVSLLLVEINWTLYYKGGNFHSIVFNLIAATTVLNSLDRPELQDSDIREREKVPYPLRMLGGYQPPSPIELHFKQATLWRLFFAFSLLAQSFDFYVILFWVNSWSGFHNFRGFFFCWMETKRSYTDEKKNFFTCNSQRSVWILFIVFSVVLYYFWVNSRLKCSKTLYVDLLS